MAGERAQGSRHEQRRVRGELIVTQSVHARQNMAEVGVMDDIHGEIGKKDEVLAGLVRESKLGDNAMSELMMKFERATSSVGGAIVAGKIKIPEVQENILVLNASMVVELRRLEEPDHNLPEEWSLIYHMDSDARRAIENHLRKEALKFSSKMQEEQMERRIHQKNVEMKQRQAWIEREKKDQEQKAVKKEHAEKVYRDLDEYFEGLREKNDERYNREYGSKHGAKIDPKEGMNRINYRGTHQS